VHVVVHMASSFAAVLLDVDGTLVESNDQHARAWVEACAEFGFTDVTFAQTRPLIGMGGDKLVDVLLRIAPEGPQSVRLRDRRVEI